MSFNHLYSMILFVLILAIPVSSETAISGEIHDYRFDSTGSPFFVEKDLIVPSGTTCVIGPGCVFLFRPFTGLTVEGTLVAEGSDEKQVIFTSINDTMFNPGSVQLPASFDWNGITVVAESNGTHFRNCRITYTVYGIRAQTPNLTIDRCIFTQNGLYHFTVMEKVFNANEGIPFSYPEAPPAISFYGQANLTTASENQGENETPLLQDIVSPAEKMSRHNKKMITIARFSTIYIEIAGIAWGGVLQKLAFDEMNMIESMNPGSINPFTGDYHNRTDESVVNAHDSFSRYKTWSIAGFILGGLGLSGFAITFFY